MIEFEILEKPQGKARPRICRYGTYTPEKTKNYEELVKYTFKSKYTGLEPLEGAIEANITAIFEVPKSYSKKRRAELLENQVHTIKPDTDNIAKIVLDSLNGLAFKDDSQVTKLTVVKMYGEQAKVIVKLDNFFK